MKPYSINDILLVAISAGCLVLLAATMTDLLNDSDWISWEGRFWLSAPVVWALVAVVIVIMFVWNRQKVCPRDYGQAFSAVFLAWITANILLGLLGVVILASDASVPKWFDEKVLFGTVTLGLAQLGLGAVFRPHMTCRPVGLLAWTLTLSYALITVPMAVYISTVFLYVGQGYAT